MSTPPAPREFGPAERAAIVEKLALGGAFLRRHADVPEIEFRAAALDALERRQSRAETSPMVDVTVRDDRAAGRTDAIVDALMVRIDPGHKPADGNREFVGLSVVEIARASLEATGQRSYGTANDVVTRALNGTSDFPLILGDVLNKSLAKAYQPANAALKAVAKQTTARDFKQKHHLSLSEGAGLERINEHGEYKRSSIKESRESYRLETFGRIFSITRQALVKVADTNPFTGKLELVVEPRLSGKQWYVAASPGEIDGLEYCYLEGEEGPQIESRPGFDVDGLEVKVRLDFAAAFVDHRGWVKNPGA